VFIDSDFINVILLSTLVGIAGFRNIIGYWFGAKVVIIYTIRLFFGSRKIPSAV
jgi:hypothetical protein